MIAKIIDGKGLAARLRGECAAEVRELRKGGIEPGLAVVLAGRDPASEVYVRNKRAACTEAGIANHDHDLAASASQEDILSLICRLNDDPKVHGILVQLPLPPHVDQQRILCAIDPAKDVDGFHPCNVGRLSLGEPCLRPCTPAAVMALIEAAGCDPAGKTAVVVGRSNIVGKPAALMLLARDATVTICHRATVDLAEEVGRGDIVVAAVGRPALIQGRWIKKGAVVIDVGINRLPDGKLAGDVEFDEAAKRAAAITPVPGGVGPMTIAMLIRNTIEAAKGIHPHFPKCPVRRR